jgi:hypothetical protein
MVEYDNEDHIIYSPMPGKPTLTPSLADRRPNIRFVGIVVASELVDYRQNSSFHHPMKAEQSTHVLHPRSVPSLSKSVSDLPHIASTSSPEGSTLGQRVVYLLFVLALLRLQPLILHQRALSLPLEQRNL